VRGALHASTNFGPQGQEGQIDYAVCVFVGLDWSGRRFAWLDRKQRACEHGQTDPEAPGRLRPRTLQQVANPKERFMREAAKRDAPKGSRHRLRLIRIGKRRKLSGISTKPGKKKVSRSAPSPAAKAAQSSSPWLGRRAKPACDRDLVRRHAATS